MIEARFERVPGGYLLNGRLFLHDLEFSQDDRIDAVLAAHVYANTTALIVKAER
jgi:hypothetical protein